MKRLLIAAHGRFAEGLESAATLIMGPHSNVSHINAFVTEVPLQTMIDDYFATVGEDDQVLVLTDAFAGSVNQKMMEKMGDQVFLITGANLPLLLELILLLDTDQPFSEKSLSQTIEQSRQQLMMVNHTVQEHVKDDFE